jgi:hypothetical protein
MLAYPFLLIYYYRLSRPPNKAITMLEYTVGCLGGGDDDNNIHFA